MAWDWDFVIRTINIVACLIALLLLARSAFIQRKLWNDRTNVYWWALVGWVFLGLESTVELIVKHVDPGPRTIVLTLVLAWTLRALTLQQDVHSGPSPLMRRRHKKTPSERRSQNHE